MRHHYIAIDLKSFYASVECIERGLNPLTTNLVVADESRTNKTICLAVSPALKTFGVPGRPRLFEVEQIIGRVNKSRKKEVSSSDLLELQKDRTLSVDYIVAVPRMALYMEYSAKIYEIYLKYISPDDIFAYSVDEVFIDATAYLNTYQTTAHDLAMTMIRDVLQQTGITATAGIGTNLYLAKIAMDIEAKHMPADKDGVRIAELDEMSYRRKLWDHTPLTDFWRVGKGYAKRLARLDLYTMGDIAEYSMKAEDILYKEFGINAELLIDHAWGWEPCTMADIKAYTPSASSLSSGQVLMEPYTYRRGETILKEMADALCLQMVAKGFATDHISLMVGYDISNDLRGYRGSVSKDYYGRTVVKPVSVSTGIGEYTTSSKKITDSFLSLYREKVDPALYVRRMTLSVDRLKPKDEIQYKQMDLFDICDMVEEKNEKEERIQEAVLEIKQRFGSNAILRGTNFEDGATGRDRNKQIGGHKG